MKPKLIIMGMIISALLAVSVSGQRIRSSTEVTLQDDKSGDHLVIVLSEGSYKFESCNENLAISGIGRISITGCKVSLEDISDDRRVLVEADLCEKTGKADIVFQSISPVPQPNSSPVVEVVLVDSNIDDSAFVCDFRRGE